MKAGKIVLIVFLSFIVGLFLIVIGGVVISGWICSTPQILTADGKPEPKSVAVLERIPVGGMDQTMLIRGRNTDNPVLLFLHGGPGMSLMSEYRHSLSALEDHFIVVQWDQRGTGKSYNPFIPDSTMNFRQFVSDAKEVVAYLIKRFGKQKIYLVGHSFGSAIGAQMVSEKPELFYAFVGVGQLVNLWTNEVLSYKYTLEQAQKANDTKALEALKKLEGYPFLGEKCVESLIAERNWLYAFGGGIYGEKDDAKVKAHNDNPEHTAFEAIGNTLGLLKSITTMWSVGLTNLNLFKTATNLNVPVVFCLGRSDYNVPTALAVDYLERIQAPAKELIWFDKSGHWALLEEPEKFIAVLTNVKAKYIQ